jgi:hypothetical protein
VGGVESCADCLCGLVDEQPALPDHQRRPSVHDLDGQFGPDDNVVELCRIPSDFQGQLLAARLRDMDIPTTAISPHNHMSTGLVVHTGTRLFVRREDAERAARVINDTYTDTPLEAPLDDIELARLAEESAEPEGWVDPDTGAVV